MSQPRVRLVALAVIVIAAVAVAILFTLRRPGGLPLPGSAEYESAVKNFQQGVAALDADVPKIAQTSLSEVIAVAPNEPAAWANRGLLYIRDGQLDKAISDLKKAETLAPNSAAVQELLGVAEQKRGDLAAAAEHLRAAVKQSPDKVRAIYRLAQVIDAQHEPDADLQYEQLLMRILELQPNNLFILQAQLRLAIRHGDRATAKQVLERLTKLSATWSDDAKDALRGVNEAVSDESAKLDLAVALPLTNLLRGERSYASDAAAVDANDTLDGLVIESFLAIVPPVHQSAPADGTMRFQPDPDFAAARKSTAIAAAWLGKDATKPAVLTVDPDGVHLPGIKTPLPGVDGGERGLVVLDWNNDFRQDILLAGAKGLRFYQQNDAGGFEDVTAKTGLSDDVVGRDYVAAWAADLDADGDLDILLAPRRGPPLELQNNFDGTFTAKPLLTETNAARVFARVDLDRDGANDIALIDEHGRLHIYANERSGHFVPWPIEPPTGRFVDLAVADIDSSGRLSLIALSEDGAIVRISDREKRSGWEVSPLEGSWRKENPLKINEARLIIADLDNNGASDIVVSTPTETRVRLGVVSSDKRGEAPWWYLNQELPGNVIAVADIEGIGRLDLVGIDGKEGKSFRLINKATAGYGWQNVRPIARQVTGDGRINSYGIGGTAEIRTGSFFARQPIDSPVVHFGLGTRQSVDVLRIVWPNGTSQVEFSPKPNALVEAQQRLKGSCPFLFAWNGRDFEFVSDFMWSTPLGMYINAQNNGELGRTTEWIAIHGDQLQPRAGKYELRVNANLWETHYFDYLSLMAIDHPPGTELVVDESFSPAAKAPAMYLTTEPAPIAHAWDQHGEDVTAVVAKVESQYLDHFARGAYQGLAEDHWVEIELPGALPPGDGPLWLLATGWIHPTDSSINFALEQGKRERPFGVWLEIPDGAGGWKVARNDLGFPAGKNKTMAIPLEAPSLPGLHVRLRTNMEIYWDALRVARGVDLSAAKQTPLTMTRADLRHRGVVEMTEANRNSPELPRYDRLVAHRQPWRDLIGYHTRFGDILELLQSIDDRYAILTAGDEMVLEFKAPAAPPAAWRRDFLWASDGWVKDGDLNTRFGKTVLPLPRHGAPYDTPPGRLQDDPVYKAHREDWQHYHTRYVSPDRFEEGLLKRDKSNN